jgi:hypothetical protein
MSPPDAPMACQGTASISNPLRGTLYFLVLVLFVANCSGSKGSSNDSNDFNKALQTYEAEATQRASTLSESLATAYFDALQAGTESPSTAVLDQREKEISNEGEFLCQRLQPLANDAGSGKAKADRMTNASQDTERIVRDAMNAALVGRALSQPPERRDQDLDSMGVKAFGADGSELRGTAAVADAGILDSNGKLQIPERGSAGYTKYLDWLGTEAKGLAGPALIRPVTRKTETCALG